MLGSTPPRLWTPPLRDLDEPDSSYGYDLIAFAEAIGWPLDPWEQWAAIHFGELLPNGWPRFRFVLILVARQNGKTTLCRVLTLYWMFVEMVPLVLGTSSDRNQAKKSWWAVIKMAEAIADLREELPNPYVRKTISEETFHNIHGSHYIFAAPNSRAGRGDTVHRTLLDELREHSTWDAYDAAINAMNAVDDAQAVAISNQCDAKGVVLDQLRESALGYIETGIGDPRLGLFEWSAPAGSRPTDVQALAQANPNLNRRVSLDSIIGGAMRAEAAGGEQLARFKTEVMCMRVHNLNPAIDETRWEACGAGDPVDLAEHRSLVVLCLDVAIDGSHCAVVAAALLDGIVHLEVAGAWGGPGCTRQMREELPALADRIRPRRIGWMPGGPAAVVAAKVRAKPGRRSWAPRRTEVAELTEEVPALCMGFADLVDNAEVHHPRDALLTRQATSAEKLQRGDRWVFVRQGVMPIDVLYAAAGAAHLARSLPPPLPPLAVATT